MGYVVHSNHALDLALLGDGTSPPMRIEGLSVSVTSKSLAAPEVARRVDAFLRTTFPEGTLAQLTSATVSEHALAIETRLMEPPKRLAAEADRWWGHIRDGHTPDWTQRERLVRHLRRVRPAAVLAMYHRLVTSEASSQLVSLVYGAAHPLEGRAEPSLGGGTVTAAEDGNHLGLWAYADSLRARRARTRRTGLALGAMAIAAMAFGVAVARSRRQK